MITVAGYLGACPPHLVVAAREAERVVGSLRALEALDVPPGKRIVMGRVAPAIDAMVAYERRPDAGPVLVLASGDPLLYGVVRRMRTAGLSCRVEPGVSSVAAAFAAVALPWDDAQLVSAHGFGVQAAVAACRALPKVAVLTAPGRGLPEIVEALADLPRWYVLAERLGEADARVRVLETAAARDLARGDADAAVRRSAQDSAQPSAPDADLIREPNVVLVLAAPPDHADPARTALGTPGAFLGGARAPIGVAEGVSPSVTAGLTAGVTAGAAMIPDLVAAAQDNIPVARRSAIELVLGRYAPVLGQIVWASGGALDPVRSFCARTGAAVLPLGRTTLPTAASGTPDLVVIEGDWSTDALRELGLRGPGRVVHVGASPLTLDGASTLSILATDQLRIGDDDVWITTLTPATTASHPTPSPHDGTNPRTAPQERS